VFLVCLTLIQKRIDTPSMVLIERSTRGRTSRFASTLRACRGITRPGGPSYPLLAGKIRVQSTISARQMVGSSLRASYSPSAPPHATKPVTFHASRPIRPSDNNGEEPNKSILGGSSTPPGEEHQCCGSGRWICATLASLMGSARGGGAGCPVLRRALTWAHPDDVGLRFRSEGKAGDMLLTRGMGAMRPWERAL
jgi:hypothetical protein